MANKPKRGGFSGTPRKRGSGKPIGATPAECQDWRDRAEARLAALGWTRADWSRESGVGKSTISDLMNGRTNECVDLDKLHKALGWEMLPALLPSLEEELLSLFRKLPDVDKGRHLESIKRDLERKP